MCENPIFVFKLAKNKHYFFTTSKLNWLQKDDSSFNKLFNLEERINFMKFRMKNLTSSNPWFEWLIAKFPMFKIPCRKCIICRYEQSVEWSIRCMLEAEKYGNNNKFVTLTYNSENVPYNGVSKDVISRFMSNLRQYFKRRQNHIGIRFFSCGEYGKNFSRPHYHVLIFNCPRFGDEKIFGKNRGWTLEKSKILNNIWGNGSCKIGTITQNSAAYVARCFLKNFNSELPEKFNPIFIHMSRNPGIGLDYFNENIDTIRQKDEIILPNGKKAKLPNYFNRKLKELLGNELYQKDFAQPRADKINKVIFEAELSEEEINKKRINYIKKTIMQLERNFESNH